MEAKQDGAALEAFDNLCRISFMELMGLTDATFLGAKSEVGFGTTTNTTHSQTDNLLFANNDYSIKIKTDPRNYTNTPATLHVPHCDRLNQEKDRNEVLCAGNEGGKLPSTAVPTSPENLNVNATKRPNNGTDLNMNKKLRPKKFWPKIADEAKPKKTPKSATPKPSTPKPQTPKLAKRKYVRKKSLHVDGQTVDSSPCKRALNFDLEDHIIDAGTIIQNAIVDKNYQREELRTENLDHTKNSIQTDTMALAEGEGSTTASIQTDAMASEALAKGEGTTSYLRVYRRIYKCLKYSRKLGPNFPTMCKKIRKRMRRQKATTWCVKKVRSRMGVNSYSTPITTERKPEFMPKDMQKGVRNSNVVISPAEARDLELELSFFPMAKFKRKRSVRSRMPPTPKFHVGSEDVRLECLGSEDVRLDCLALEDVRLEGVGSEDVRLESVHINDGGGQLAVQDQSAYGTLVPYEGPKKSKSPSKVDILKLLSDGSSELLVQNALVPYEGKKSKLPSKAEIVKLLMENDGGSEALEGEDKDKDNEKWWGRQREVFRGRVDSFTARMHLIQGNRRFSPWKGSVVDSIVGVFLTQNVSDHLSSSAFMSLAARFPLQPTSNHRGCDEEGEIASSQESVGSNTEAVGENPTVFTEFSQLKETAFLQEFYSQENKKLSCDESATDRNTDSIQMKTGKQGSSPDRVFDLNRAYESVCSPGSHNPCSNVLLAPSHLEVDSVELLEDFGNTNMKDVWKMGNNLGCREFSGSNNSTQAEARTVKNMNKSKNDQRRNEMNLQRNKRKLKEKEEKTIDWDELRKTYSKGRARENIGDTMDSVNWEDVRRATVEEVAKTIARRGMHNGLALRIKEFLDRVVRDHGSLNLEWLRDVPPEKAKEFLLNINGLGLKSVECLRLLTLHHVAFPVDTNVGRVAVRLGWVPLQPLPEEVQIHLLERYPLLDEIQRYLWPRLCTLDQRKLYELHYHMITFGKVFCTKRRPNCNACPMKGECRHYASAYSSARRALPGTQEKSMASSKAPVAYSQNPDVLVTPMLLSLPETKFSELRYQSKGCEPIIEHLADIEDFSSKPAACQPIVEHPASPGPYSRTLESDIEDLYSESEDEILHIVLNAKESKENLLDYRNQNNNLLAENSSRALVVSTSEAASRPVPKLKHVARLMTMHQVYELPDIHPLLSELDRREPHDPCPYLLAIRTTDGSGTANSFEPPNSCEPPKSQCNSQESEVCNENSCFSCNNIQEQNCQTVWGTILIPSRTALRGRFPLNGTYFQVNEVFADDESSQHPISVPRGWIWSLPRRTLYCGTSATTIFRGLSTEEIQYCNLRGFVCVRAFNRKTRAPKPLGLRFHVTGKTGKTKIIDDE